MKAIKVVYEDHLLTSWLDHSYIFYFVGSFTIPVKISPPAIFLRPPEKLVVEVSASGGYAGIVWSRDGSALGSTAAPTLLSEFTNFFEIFVREPTTTSDYGAYDISYSGQGGVGTEILVVPPGKH